jgi:PhzF family phenazine biosynthesis protein
VLEPAELDAVLSALALDRAELDPRCPPMIAGAASGRLLLGVREAASLARLTPNLTRLSELSAQLATPGYFLFTLQPSQAAVFSEARMFCPALGIDEDPVSGNAHALLGAYLLHHELLSGSDLIEFSGAQGHYVGRPGRVTVLLELDQRRLRRVSIMGEAVIVFATTLIF